MIAERALTLAGSDAVLATRPAGVPHVYVGPLTPSGRYVPRTGRTVCRAHTRRLSVVTRDERWSSLDPDARRLCARCSARLADLDPRPGEPSTPRTRTRQEWRREYAALTEADVAAALEGATTVEEVDAAAHLSLLLFTVAGCRQPFTYRGRTWPQLDRLVRGARDRLGVFDTDAARAARAEDTARLQASNAQRAEERRQSWRDREDRIRRLGYLNAVHTAPP